MLNEIKKYDIPEFIVKNICALEHHLNNKSMVVFGENEKNLILKLIQLMLNVKFSIENGESLFQNIKNEKFNLDNGYGEIITIPLHTKKECHLFLNSDQFQNNWFGECKYYFINGILSSWVISNQGSLKLLENIILCGKFKIGLFIKHCVNSTYKIIKWLCKIENQINFNDINMNLIIDYLKFNFKNDANFSLKNRTYKSIIKKIEKWYKELNIKQYEKFPKTWEKSNICEFKTEDNIYIINEILNIDDLYIEGKELQHCILTHIEKIHNEKITIWSLKMNGKRLLTIELDKLKNVIQIRGYKNRLITIQEMIILDEWFNREGLIKTKGNMERF